MKPLYLIIYTNDNWKIEFYKKRLFRYSEDLISSNDETYDFKYFKVMFSKFDNSYEHLQGLKPFGIILENNDDITDDMINIELKTLIENPFIGSVCVMR